VPAVEPCGAGAACRRSTRCFGRTRDIFRFADGTRIGPELKMAELRRLVPHRQQQVVQVALDRIEFRYVPLIVGADQRHRGPDSLPANDAAPDDRGHGWSRWPLSPAREGGKYDDFLSLLGRPD